MFKDERRRVKKNQMDKEKYSSVKCYFARMDSLSPDGCEDNYILSRKTVSEARQLFMHIHTLSTIEKYIARLTSAQISSFMIISIEDPLMRI